MAKGNKVELATFICWGKNEIIGFKSEKDDALSGIKYMQEKYTVNTGIGK